MKMLRGISHITTMLLILCLTSLGCNENIKAKVNKPTVLLQPLQFADTTTLQLLKDSVAHFYNVSVVIAADKLFPAHAYYKPRNRYRADSTIKWLKQLKPDSVRTIVGITNEDISVSKAEHKDYGVMGLGYSPGHVCIVSTFRPSKTATSKRHLQQRMVKLVLHEMGHNFGLPHCSNETCFMVDAEGQMKLDQEKELCEACRKKLKI